jgi:hypothetical protein
VLSAPRVIAAPVGDIGAPRRLNGRAYVSSVRLNCSTPRFDRSDGPPGACLKGAGSPAAEIVSLIPGQAAVVRQRRQQYRCAISVRAARLNFDVFNASVVHARPPFNAPTHVRRPTAAPWRRSQRNGLE